MDLKTSNESWIILAFNNPQFALASFHDMSRQQGVEAWGPARSQVQPAKASTDCSLGFAFVSWKIGRAVWNLTTSDLLHWFQQDPDICFLFFFFSCCWIEDAENGSWFTSDQMDLAEWFNSSHAAGCRKILSHFTERMFLLSFLVITYLHELAQLGGVRRELCGTICLHIIPLILRPDYKDQKGILCVYLQRTWGHCHFNPNCKLVTGVNEEKSMHSFWPRSTFHIQNAIIPTSSSLNYWSVALCAVSRDVQQVFSDWLMDHISWLNVS